MAPTLPLCAVQLPLNFCPSDRWAMWFGDPFTRSRGSYVVNFSNGSYNNSTVAGAGTFYSGPFYLNQQYQLKKITDGLSGTMFMSEIVIALKDNYYDTRGDMLNDDSGCAEYMTVNTPNAGVDGYMLLRRGSGQSQPMRLTCFPAAAINRHAAGIREA